MTTAEYLNKKKVSFVDVNYGELIVRGVDGMIRHYIKTPWSNTGIYYDNKELVYNAVWLDGNKSYKEIDSMTDEKYLEYLKEKFVCVDCDERVVRCEEWNLKNEWCV